MADQPLREESTRVSDFVAAQASLVRCDGCGAEWSDIDAATHQDGYSEKGCPNRCGRLTTPVYWPDEHTNHWKRYDD
jgi:hypothetical protein